jgi:type IV secretory pathway TraG/TraD family ATPase VirD4
MTQPIESIQVFISAQSALARLNETKLGRLLLLLDEFPALGKQTGCLHTGCPW